MMAETLGNIEAKSLFGALADTLLEVEPETPRNTLADLMTKALIDALPERLEKHGATWRLRHWPTRFLKRYQRWWPRQLQPY